MPALSDTQKLHLTFRVEPGCLGPDGANYVDDFCAFAQTRFGDIDKEFIRWEITPRNDKSLPETEYRVNEKKLDADKAERYLRALEHNLDEVEDHLHSTLATLIDEFMRG
ncbi:MAG: hypothetical protein R3183_05265 [Oleiphilaceae bacterium]|nr:hypothetical protein [Oleiphilaceae bacterium]